MSVFTTLRLSAVLLVLGSALLPRVCEAKLILVAHRGGMPGMPENTLAAFHRSNDVADYVEYDVRSTKDGQLVVIHDSDVDRTTNGKGNVADLTLAQIRQLDAGSWAGALYAGEKIPTAEEAIAAIQTEAAPFMERKTGTVEQFVALLDRQPIKPEGIVMSFDYDFATALKRAKPEVQVGWIGTGALAAADIARATTDGITHFVWGAADIDASMVQAVHRAGGLVFGWTVDDDPTVGRLNALGVDGIITDRAADWADDQAFACALGTDRPQPPARSVVRPGRSAMLSAATAGRFGRRVEWRRTGGTEVVGRGRQLRIRTAAGQDYGRYVASWVESGVTKTFEHDLAAAPADNQLINISGRMTVGTGEAVGVVGFVIKSAQTPRFLLRAVGPSLAPLGVTDFVPKPALTLFRKGIVIGSASAGTPTQASSADFARNGAFPFSGTDTDVAVSRELGGGLYTAHLSAADGRPGVGLIEVYQDNTPANWAAGAPMNLSIRGRATPESPLIVGFVVPEGSSQTLLIRGLGPSLGKLGINEPLPDPVLRLFSKGTLVAANDDWWSDSDTTPLQTASTISGAFKIPSGREAAILVTLPPGAYTATLTDASGRPGIGLLELYDVNPSDLSEW
jgi:glycerophosphoryl diester phosphodiesterase